MCKTLRHGMLLGALSLGSVGVAQVVGQDSPFGIFSLRPLASARPAEEKSSSSVTPEPRRIATRLATFGIPIVAPTGREGVKEIQLHVSADLGKTWHLYYRVKPTDKYFPFKAAADGEYWFATRVVDATAKANQEGDLRPEMKVMIDTTPPKLAITSQIAENGEIRAAWQATDPLLSPQSLKLEYQTSPNGPWRSIALPAATATNKNGALTGNVTWRPRDAEGMINLRAEIIDQAGNHAVALDRVEPGAFTQGAIAQGMTPLEPPIAGPAQGPMEKAKNEGALASVSKWFGGALSGGSKSKSVPADPYASATTSDEASSHESATAHQPSKPAPSNWAGSNTEFTDKGVRRIPVPSAESGKTENPDNSDENHRVIAEKRSPGRFASATTVREPKRETPDEESLRDSSNVSTRPSIQPPENAVRDSRDTQSGVLPDNIPPSEPEEIPAPREVERPSTPTQPEEAAPPPMEAPTAPRQRAVESLPKEDSRSPIPSAPRKKPEEFRTRKPIASGLKADEAGAARPPASPPYRNASTARDPVDNLATSNRLPSGVEPIYSKHLRFGLEYDVNTVGAGGVSEVELWATRDGGQSWSRWGSDPDRRSPFEVEVDGEGAFGFRIVVMSRGGLASRPPQPGDEADQWVVVDSTAPQVALRGAGYGAEERVGQLEISWDAQDANLTEKSVSLYYSDREEGPWTRIVGDLANQGEYFWRVDSRIPPKIFIKVEVRDGAGNLATDMTRDAIRVEGLVPSGKIRRIIPRDEDRE